jgi:hypothetical protein
MTAHDEVSELLKTIQDASRKLDEIRPAKIAEHLDALKALGWDGIEGMRERGWSERTPPPRKVAARGRARRRSGEEKAEAIETGVDKVVAALHVAKNGKKAEELVRVLPNQKDWNAVINEALKRKAIRKTGNKRATTYFAAAK